MKKARLVFFGSLLSCFTCLAESSDLGFIIVGPAISPEYQGSDDYKAVPMIIADLTLGPYNFEAEGLTFRSNLFTHDNVQFGITSELDTGRGDDIENAKVATFEKIDFSVNLGAYINHQIDNIYLDGDNFNTRFSLFTDASNVHKGTYATLELSYTFPLMIPWRVELELTSTYADDQYMQTYFGVNHTNANFSGLSPYSVNSSSFRDVSLNANIGLFMSPKWGAFVRAGATQLLGNAKDSPITALGNDKQYFLGIGAFYRFGG